MARQACAGEQTGKGCWCPGSELVLLAEREEERRRAAEQEWLAERLRRNQAAYQRSGGFARWLRRSGAVDRPLKLVALKRLKKMLEGPEEELAREVAALESALEEALRSVKVLRGVMRERAGQDG